MTRHEINRDEWRKQAMGEMTAGELFGSLAIILSVLVLLLAFLWISEPEREAAEAQSVEVTP